MRAALSLRMMSYANDWLCIYWSGANVKDGVWFTENTATLPRSHSRSTIFLPTTFPENMKLWAQVRYPHDRQNVTLKTIISIFNYRTYFTRAWPVGVLPWIFNFTLKCPYMTFITIFGICSRHWGLFFKWFTSSPTHLVLNFKISSQCLVYLNLMAQHSYFL